MGDIKLFRVKAGSVMELEGKSSTIEKSLQTLIERYLDSFLGVRMLASEYSTGSKHRGRIDTLGIDENGYPVIIEYKRATNENVINQGLFYLDWLMDHKAEFKLLVLERYGAEVAEAIEWSSPRLLCIAGDFTNYDEHAVQQINRNIELLRYRWYGDELMLLELVNMVEAAPSVRPSGESQKYTTVRELLEKSPPELQDLFELVRAYLMALGDDIQMKETKFYFAFKRIMNFACVEVHPQSKKLLVYLKVDPETTKLERGFTRDVRNIGHFGTGDFEVTVKKPEDLEKAKALLLLSYEGS